MSSAPVEPSLAQGCAGLGRIAVAQRQEAIGNTPHAGIGSLTQNCGVKSESFEA